MFFLFLDCFYRFFSIDSDGIIIRMLFQNNHYLIVQKDSIMGQSVIKTVYNTTVVYLIRCFNISVIRNFLVYQKSPKYIFHRKLLLNCHTTKRSRTITNIKLFLKNIRNSLNYGLLVVLLLLCKINKKNSKKVKAALFSIQMNQKIQIVTLNWGNFLGFIKIFVFTFKDMNQTTPHLLLVIVLGMLFCNALATQPLLKQSRMLDNDGDGDHDGEGDDDDDHGSSSGKIAIFVIIPIAVVVVILVICCLGFCCFREKIARCLESRKRSVEPINMKQDDFQKCFNQFKDIFGENKDGHNLKYFQNGREVAIRFNSFTCKHLEPFRYKVDIKGQDLAGEVLLDGEYVKTKFGITFWFFKKYTNAKIVAQQKSPFIVFESLRVQDKNIYRGQWYFRGYEIQREKWSLAPSNEDGTVMGLSDDNFSM